MKIRFSNGMNRAIVFDNIFTPQLLKQASFRAMQKTEAKQYFLHVSHGDEWWAVKCSVSGKDHELYLCEGVYMYPEEAFSDCQRTLAQRESIGAVVSNLGKDVSTD